MCETIHQRVGSGHDPVVRPDGLRRGDVPKGVLGLGVLIALVSMAAVACGGEELPTATPQPASPLPPPSAPIATTPPSEPVAEGSETEGATGSQVAVAGQDPGGSGKYQFGPNEMTFGVGEVVTFTLSSETEFHTFTVDDLGIDVPMDPGSSETLTFTFDNPGTFQLICIPHEFQGMVGSITVK